MSILVTEVGRTNFLTGKGRNSQTPVNGAELHAAFGRFAELVENRLEVLHAREFPISLKLSDTREVDISEVFSGLKDFIENNFSRNKPSFKKPIPRTFRDFIQALRQFKLSQTLSGKKYEDLSFTCKRLAIKPEILEKLLIRVLNARGLEKEKQILLDLENFFRIQIDQKFSFYYDGKNRLDPVKLSNHLAIPQQSRDIFTNGIEMINNLRRFSRAVMPQIDSVVSPVRYEITKRPIGKNVGVEFDLPLIFLDQGGQGEEFE